MNHKEVFNQLTQSNNGMGRLKAMVGGNNFVAGKDYVAFRFKMSKFANYVKITLTGADLYDVEYGKIWGKKYTVKKTSKGLYNDMLKDDFEKTVGLNIKLF